VRESLLGGAISHECEPSWPCLFLYVQALLLGLTLPKSTSAILSTSNNLLVSGAAAATPPDMASTTMEAESTTRAPKQWRSDMRGAQHADATQQPPAMINRRVPDKTHTCQPVPELFGLRTGANGRHVPDPPPRGHMAPISARAHAPQRAADPRAHTPPGARSPGRFRASPASPGDGSGVCVVSRRCHFEPMAALLARNPLRIHPETFHFPY
jgi:hypothetical protein